MIKLGDKVKDSITGFSGVATGRCEYLNGCISWQVCANKLENGKEVIEWFDEQRLTSQSKAKAGGPQNRPPQMHP